MKYFPEHKAIDGTTFIDLYRQGFDRYCRQLAEYYGCLNNQGLALLDDDADTEQDSPLIDDLFILPSFDTSATSAENFDTEQQALQAKNNISTAQLLASKPRQFILGDPGIGKTTFLHWLATSLAHHRSNYVKQSMGPLLPILLRVRDFRSYLTTPSDAEQFIGNLKSYLGSLGELLDLELLTQAMANGQVLLLVDGLDEIGKQEMLNLGHSLATLFSQFPAIKCIMTARVVGFDASQLWPVVNNNKKIQTQQPNELNEADELNDLLNDELNDEKIGSALLSRKTEASQRHDFALYYIQPLNNEQRLQFSQKWCKIYVKNSDAQAQFIEDLRAAFSDNGSLNNLSRTPVLLNMICFIQHRRGRLPNGRAELYQEIIKTYLVTMDKARGIENDFIDSEDFDYTDIRNWLAKLAYAMQLGKLDELLTSVDGNAPQIESLCFDSEIPRSTSLTERTLLSFFAKELEEVYEDPNKCLRTAEKLIDYIKRRTGFLIDRGQDAEQGHDTVFAFSHLSFQEYFAAHFISQQWSQLSHNAELVDSLTLSCDNQSWFECWQLVFEDYSQNGNSRQQHTQFINNLFGPLDELAKKLNYDLETYWSKQDHAVHLLSKIILNPAVKLPPNYRQQQLTHLWLHNLNLDQFDSSASIQTLWPELCRDYDKDDSLSRRAIAVAFDHCDQENVTNLDLNEVKTADLRPLKLWPDLIYLNLSHTQIDSLQPLADFDKLEFLKCDNTLISDLTPLTRLTELRILSVSDTTVSDLAPLAQLSKLEALHINNTNVSDLVPLVKLSNLLSLSFSTTEVSDLTPLVELTQLTYLDINDTAINGLTPLTKLIRLECLKFNDTEVSDLTPVANLTQLNNLSFCHTHVSNLNPIANLTKLMHINCYNTAVADLKPFTNLAQLRGLVIMDTKVSDLTPLAKLTQLRILNVSKTAVSDLTPIAKLKKLDRVFAIGCDQLDPASLEILPKSINVITD